MVEEEEEKKKGRRRREEEKRRREEEEEEGRREVQEFKVWNRTMDYMYRICAWKICVWKFGIELFGLAVVLNGGKICIEKLLGFRIEAVHFF